MTQTGEAVSNPQFAASAPVKRPVEERLVDVATNPGHCVWPAELDDILLESQLDSAPLLVLMVTDPATGEKVKSKSKKWWGQ